MTKKLGARTMPDYFEKRYHSKGMKILAAVIVFVFLVPYSAAVYKGLGSLFSAVFPGVETWVWMLIIATLTAIYLVLGGYIATAYTDLVQGVIMIAGVVCLVVAVGTAVLRISVRSRSGENGRSGSSPGKPTM